MTAPPPPDPVPTVIQKTDQLVPGPEQLTAAELRRYSRPLLLPEWSQAGAQERLKAASVLVVASLLIVPTLVNQATALVQVAPQLVGQVSDWLTLRFPELMAGMSGRIQVTQP